MARKKQSALIFVLKGLIPYSRENLMLAFSPNKFFNELEKISRYDQKVLRNAYYRGRKSGYITGTNTKPKMTRRGVIKIQPFVTTKLTHKGRLMIIFDIPENKAALRQQLRMQLKDWQFEQIQKSVWATDLDYREGLAELIEELHLGKYLQIYEGAKLFP